MSSQFCTMPLVIGYAVSSMSRAFVTSSPTMMSFSSMSWIFSSERRIGRPMIDGKMCAGKLSPANPHLTKPVPLSQTTGGFVVMAPGEPPR